MATLVSMATVHDKNPTYIPYETTEPVLMKFHLKLLYDNDIKFSHAHLW